MVSTILSLTPELLGLVLGHDGVQHTSILLWTTGSKLLQRNLALGVTRVSLSSLQQYSLCCVPPILKEFRHLRELLIQRGGYRILFPSSATSTLRSLSPTIQVLELDFLGAPKILFPSYTGPEVDPEAERGDSSDSDTEEAGDASASVANSHLEPQEGAEEWSLKSSFPQLSRLVLQRCYWTSELASHLPDSLTDLQVLRQPDLEKFKALIAALPPNMQHLSFDERSVTVADLLPLVSRFELQTLDCTTHSLIYDPQVIAQLPRTLTTTNVISGGLKLAAIAALPPALTTLSNLTLHDDEDKSALFLDHLRDLRVVDDLDDEGPFLSLASLKRLPSKLEELTCTADLDGMKKEDWPPCLTSLECTPRSSNLSLASLPPLQILFLQGTRVILSMASIGELPRTLVSLRCTCGPIDPNGTIDFPPDLTLLNLQRAGNDPWIVLSFQVSLRDEADAPSRTYYLDADFDPHNYKELERCERPLKVVSCFPFRCLPRYVEQLYLPCPIPASQLVHLPPTVQDLSAIDIFLDVDFDPNEPRLAEKMAENFKAAGIVPPPSRECSLPSSPASLLPRGLSSLTCRGGRFWSECDWARMPSSLFALSTHSTRPVSVQLMFKESSLARLEVAMLPLANFTDEIVRSLPLSLEAALYSEDEVEISDAAFPYWPCNIDWINCSEVREAVWKGLQAKRRNAIASSSIADLRELFPNCYLNKLYQE